MNYFVQCLSSHNPFVHIFLLGIGVIGLAISTINASNKHQHWIDIGQMAMSVIILMLSVCIQP